jgi:predicted ester cyclase
MVTETEETNRVDRVIEEAFNNGELDVIDEVIASNYEMHGSSATWEFRGPEGFKENVRMHRTAFPDLTLTVEDRVVEGTRSPIVSRVGAPTRANSAVSSRPARRSIGR